MSEPTPGTDLKVNVWPPDRYAERNFTPLCSSIEDLGARLTLGIRPGFNAFPFIFSGRTFPPGTLTAEKPVHKETPDGGFEVTYRFTFTPAPQKQSD